MTPRTEKSEADSTSAATAGGSGSDERLSELRRILVESDAVSQVLPTALRKSADRDRKLAEATLPVVEENIRQSAKRNPKTLAEAIFPIIGPAIRKAIAEALAQMVQSLNQALEHGLSPRGIRWRLEAIRTGRPFAEIVLLNTLLYRVEQVFLIDKDTGILLRHVTVDPTATEDGDMVSAMLTAIQDFVHDSFRSSEDATLDSLKVRDLSVWIEYGPDTILAAVIRGNAPLALRETLLEAIEEVQLEFERELRDFRGDVSGFDRAGPILERCLRLQLGGADERSKALLSPFNAVAAVLLIAALIAAFFIGRDYWRWSGFVSEIRSRPGFVVTEAEHGFWRHSISGLRDEFAADPETIRADSGLDRDDVTQNWRPFQDTVPDFVVRRARRLLAPPTGVELSFANGVLSADGDVPRQWFAEARRIAPAINGVASMRVAPGSLASAIGRERIAFVCGTTDLAAGEDQKVSGIVSDLEELFRGSTRISVEVEGIADPSGTDPVNADISRGRAVRITEELLRRSEVLRARSENLRSVGSGATGGAGECVVRLRVDLEKE